MMLLKFPHLFQNFWLLVFFVDFNFHEAFLIEFFCNLKTKKRFPFVYLFDYP